MDKLERIFEMQEFFQKDLIARRNLGDIPTDKWIQMQTLAMLSELAELIDEVLCQHVPDQRHERAGAVRQIYRKESGKL